MMHHGIAIVCPASPSTLDIPIVIGVSNYAISGCVSVGFVGVVPLPWPKVILMMLQHQSGNYTKFDDTVERDGYACMSLNTTNLYLDSGPWLC